MKMHRVKVPIAENHSRGSTAIYPRARPYTTPKNLDAQIDPGRPGAVPSDELFKTEAFTDDHRLRTVGVWTNDGGRYRHQQAKQRCHTGKHMALSSNSRSTTYRNTSTPGQAGDQRLVAYLAPKDLRPVLSYLLAADEGSIRVHRLLDAVLRNESRRRRRPGRGGSGRREVDRAPRSPCHLLFTESSRLFVSRRPPAHPPRVLSPAKEGTREVEPRRCVGNRAARQPLQRSWSSGA